MSELRNLWGDYHRWFPMPLTPPEESVVMSFWQTDRPLISILCPAYNHENTLKDALNGFLSQKSEFPFEVIVRDDASTDKTGSVIREFSERYPRIVRGIFEESNTYKTIAPLAALMQECSGEFVAFCEGDDFWTDDRKLNDQMQLANELPNVALIAARHWELDLDGSIGLRGRVNINRLNHTRVVDYTDQGSYLHTSTYLLPRSTANLWTQVLKSSSTRLGDTALRYFCLNIGPIVVLNRAVSVYRKTGTGVWTSLSYAEKLKWELSVARHLAEEIPAQRSFHQRRVRSLRKQLLKIWLRNSLITTPVNRDGTS